MSEYKSADNKIYLVSKDDKVYLLSEEKCNKKVIFIIEQEKNGDISSYIELCLDKTNEKEVPMLGGKKRELEHTEQINDSINIRIEKESSLYPILNQFKEKTANERIVCQDTKDTKINCLKIIEDEDSLSLQLSKGVTRNNEDISMEIIRGAFEDFWNTIKNPPEEERTTNYSGKRI